MLQMLAARMEQERSVKSEMDAAHQTRVNAATIAKAMPPLRHAERAKPQTHGQLARGGGQPGAPAAASSCTLQ